MDNSTRVLYNYPWLSLANTIDRRFCLFSPGLSLRACKEEQLLLVLIFEFAPHKCEAFVGSGGRKSAVSVELGMAERSDHCVGL